MSIKIHKTISLIEPLSKENQQILNNDKPLKKFGRKKTVSFSKGISIIDVEKWKKYNVDVSAVGGCSSWDIKKNEEKYNKQQAKRFQEEGCVCIIF